MNLELVPTDELIHELVSRYDSCIFYGVKDPGPGAKSYHYTALVVGNNLVCAGMGADAQREALEALAAKRVKDQHP